MFQSLLVCMYMCVYVCVINVHVCVCVMNVCVYVCACSEVNHIAEIAGKVQDKLDAFKADKRELGTVSGGWVWWGEGIEGGLACVQTCSNVNSS